MTYFYGTAGWSYADWEGRVYPQSKSRGFNPLEFLSRDFDFVEVNTTFYRIPSLKLTQGWVNKTEALNHFNFWIKIHQSLTHQKKTLSQEIDQFKQSLKPLERAGKLTGLLAQFPYSFKLCSENIEYLQNIRDIFAEFQLAVEFRHRSWNRDDILRFFKEYQLIWVNIDQPVISLSLPLTSYVTHPETVYFRLHGRNYRHWFAEKGRDARYDYDYSTKELNQISDKIKKLTDLVKQIFISGNNHYKGAAVKNLKELKKLLQKDNSPDNSKSP